MSRLVRKFLLAGGAVGVFAAGAAYAQVADSPQLGPAAVADTHLIAANMTGAKERPTPTAETATGSATIVLNSVTGQACIFMSSNLAEPITGLHIHTGGPEDSAGVLINFGFTAGAPGGTTISRCGAITATSVADVAAVIANPGGYYLNAHTATYPAGAIRSQLSALGGRAGELVMFDEPQRVYDSRSDAAGKLAANSTRTITAGAPFGIRAVLITITITGADAAGYAVVYANSLTEPPKTSSVNWIGGLDVATTAPVSVDGQGRIKVTLGPTSGAHVLVDLVGYFSNL